MDMVVTAASFILVNVLKAGESILRNFCLINRNKGLLSIKSNGVDCCGREGEWVAIDIEV